MYAGLPYEDYDIETLKRYESRDILAQTAADLGSATKEDFAQALAGKDIRMDDHRLSYHIRMAEMSGTLCSGELLPLKATYSLTAEKVKPTAKMDHDEALMRFTVLRRAKRHGRALF